MAIIQFIIQTISGLFITLLIFLHIKKSPDSNESFLKSSELNKEPTDEVLSLIEEVETLINKEISESSYQELNSLLNEYLVYTDKVDKAKEKQKHKVVAIFKHLDTLKNSKSSNNDIKKSLYDIKKSLYNEGMFAKHLLTRLRIVDENLHSRLEDIRRRHQFELNRISNEEISTTA